jgi:tripartite-type tricarboxylate transporter receptor subunit TctC
MKPIAITGLKRHPAAARHADLRGAGLQGLHGRAVVRDRRPAKMPADVVKRLNDEINKAIATPELKQRLAGEALDPMPMTPAVRQVHAGRHRAWAKLAQERNIKLED